MRRGAPSRAAARRARARSPTQPPCASSAGERRAHVAIVCGQACTQRLLPELIEGRRRDRPAVTFSVRVCGRAGAEPALADYSADIAMVFEGE